MKIQAVLIDGFKNLSNVKINFSNITALISLNNFGKSNVLSAIDFGLSFIKASSEQKAEMMANTRFIPICKSLAGRNFKFEIEVSAEFKSSQYTAIYGYELAWKYRENKDPIILSEYLKFRPGNKKQKYTQIIRRTSNNASYKSSETGRCSSDLKVENTELAINKLKAFDDLFYIQIIKDLNSMKFHIEDNLDVKSFYKPYPVIKSLENLTIDAENLPRVIYQLSQIYPDKFALLKNIYRNLFPEIQDIIAEQYYLNPLQLNHLPELSKDPSFVAANSIYALYVKNFNLISPIDFAMMSDGAKRVFVILTRIILANQSNVSLIAIEEPENSVHPGLLQAYIQTISQLLDNCNIIITSHSPYIISYLDPSWIQVGISRHPGVAEFFKFNKEGRALLQKDASDFDMTTGDYLFSMLADEDNNWEEYLECTNNE